MFSVVIPACNEEKTIKTTIYNLVSFFKKEKIDYEIIVIEDGSKDKTAEIVKKISQKNKKVKLIHHGERLGKGRAVRIGFKKSSGDLILTYDADASMPPSEIKKLLAAAEKKASVIIGSRYMKGSKIKESKTRLLFSRIFNLFFRLLFFNVKDTQSGYKLMNKPAMKLLLPNLKCNGFEWDIELLKVAKNKGVLVKEVPIVWMHREESKVNPLTDGVKLFISLIKIRFWR